MNGPDLARGLKPRIRWARRARPELIRRLYENDAAGIHDPDLINEVGYALLARCRSIVQVTRSEEGHVICPGCGGPIVHDREPETVLLCAHCGWTLPWLAYRRTYRKKKLYAPAAMGIIGAYLAEFPTARSPGEKMLAIDRLIHLFHAQDRKWPTAPVSKNLIEGNVQQVVALLNDLAYGPQSAPELLQTRSLYRATLARSWAGGAERPMDWRAPIDRDQN